MQRIYLAEYSPTQRCYHVDLLEDCVQANRQALARGHVPDYIPLGAFPTREAAGAFAAAYRRRMERPVGRLPHDPSGFLPLRGRGCAGGWESPAGHRDDQAHARRSQSGPQG